MPRSEPHTDLPHAFDDNRAWHDFRTALRARGGRLALLWECATGRHDLRGPNLRCYRVHDCQGSSVGNVIVLAAGDDGFEIYEHVRPVEFGAILDELDIGDPRKPAA